MLVKRAHARIRIPDRARDRNRNRNRNRTVDKTYYFATRYINIQMNLLINFQILRRISTEFFSSEGPPLRPP